MIKWISIQNVLPKKDKEVLVYSPVYDTIDIGKCSSYTDGVYINEQSKRMGREAWYRGRNTPPDIEFSFTHWMPLPKTPYEYLRQSAEGE